MGRGCLTGLALTGCLLLSLLSLAFTASFEPFQSEDDSDAVTGLSAQQISALEELPTSVNVGGRSGSSTDYAWNWARWAGCRNSGSEYGAGIAVDSNGNAYVTGQFRDSGSNSPAIFGGTELYEGGFGDAFVAKLSSNGSWQWAVKASSSRNIAGVSIALDSSGNPYITGSFSSSATFGSIYLPQSSSYYSNIFVAKLSTGGSWQWAVQAGTDDGYDYSNGIAIDSSGNAYVTGGFVDTATFGSISLTSSGGDDIFIAKLSSSGSWQWAVKAGGAGAWGSSEAGNDVAVHSSGNIFVTGYFADTATFGSTNLTSDGDTNIFVAKLDSSGNWQWAIQAGGSMNNRAGVAIATDSSGFAYVTGNFEGTATFGSTSLTHDALSDIFVAKVSSSGSWQWAVKAGGLDDDYVRGIAVDSSGNAYVTGVFSGDLTFGSSSLTSVGDTDIFIAKLDSSGNWQWAIRVGGSQGSYDVGYSIVVDSTDNAYVTGSFTGTATFGNISLSGGSGTTEIFIAKLSPDSDGDGVADSSDQCEGHDDSVDVDGDGTPDGCDPLVDSDSDGVADISDQCEGHDDSVDVDADGTPDGCDSLIDSDFDGVADSSDQCEGYDDSVDVDADGTPDGCDTLIDSDNDGVADISDLCPNTHSYVAYQVDSDGCVWEEKDDDGDTILNYEDSCPATPANETADTEGCSPNQMDADGDGVADISDQCPGTLVYWSNPDDNNLNDIDDVGCSSEQRDSDGDGFNDAWDQCPNYDDRDDADGDGNPDGCDSLIDSDGDGVADSSDQCPNYDDRDDADGDGIPNRCDTTPEGLLEESDVDSGVSVVGISSMICLVIIGLLLVIGIMKRYGSRGRPNLPRVRNPSPLPVFPLPSPVQGMEQQAAPVSYSGHLQNLQSTVNQLELERQQAEYDADLLRKQLSDSASFTDLQIQEMQAEMARLQQTVEQTEQEKSTMQDELEKAKSTTVVQNITYNIQDSAIAGDINATGLKEKDD